MPDQTDPDFNYEELEIDLREYILLLWRKKWIILALIIFAAVSAYVYTIATTEVEYRATSEVLLMPPRHTEIDVSRMDKSTYVSLGQSDDILGRIIEKLDMRDEDGELLHPANIEDSMELSILENNRDFGDDVSFLMRMEVVRTDPQEASDIANTWAEQFKQDTLDVRRGEIEEIAEVTQKRAEETIESLEQAQDELRDLKREARLEQLKVEKEAFRENLKILEEEILKVASEFDKKTAEKEELAVSIAGKEDEGIWQGEIYTSLQRDDDLPDYIDDLLVAQERLGRASGQLYQLELARIEEVIAGEPEKFSLQRTLSDDAFWDNIYSPEELDMLGDLALEDEVVNPVYEMLREDRAELETEAFAYLSDKAPSIDPESILDGEAPEGYLTGQFGDYRQELELLEQDVEHYQSVYEGEAARYRDQLDRHSELVVETASLEAQLNMFEKRREDLQSNIEDIEDRIWDYEDRVANLEREVNKYEESYDRISRELEEARLAKAEQTSDVRFVSEAVPPGRTIRPNTTLNVAIAIVLAGMIGVFGVFFQEFMKEEEHGEEK